MSEFTNNIRSTPFSRRLLLGALPLAHAAFAQSASTPAPTQTDSSSAASDAETVMGLKFLPCNPVRMAFIGTGGRGTDLIANFLGVGNLRINALCDIDPAHAAPAKDLVEKSGGGAPALYTAGERDFERLCHRDDIDLVVIATPWQWHVPMAVCAMLHGKHVAVEVPAATTMEDCWTLVRTSEQTRRHCIMLENCCYGYNEMLVLTMVRAGKLGALTHGAGGYLHDLRGKLTSETQQPWLRQEYIRRNGNLYPTHGLGPVARYMGIHRGDRFDNLVSYSSPSRSLAESQSKRTATKAGKPLTKFRCGDQNTSLIRTAHGLLISLEHNVSSPEPYDRINLIAGTGGIFRDYPPRIYVDGETEENTWESLDRYKAAYQHPLWTKIGEKARGMGGHDGMDFVMCYRLIECITQGLAPDMDVYDAAAWSAVAPLSEISIASGGTPVAFPDFTRGRWTSNA